MSWSPKSASTKAVLLTTACPLKVLLLPSCASVLSFVSSQSPLPVHSLGGTSDSFASIALPPSGPRRSSFSAHSYVLSSPSLVATLCAAVFGSDNRGVLIKGGFKSFISCLSWVSSFPQTTGICIQRKERAQKIFALNLMICVVLSWCSV